MRDSAEYREFWAKLGRGEYQSAEYKRLGKGGREVWIQASYNPVFDRHDKPFKVVKLATDITAAKICSMKDAGKIAAVDRAQAVIEFNLDGTILTANQNFLDTMGYTLDGNPGQASQHVRRAGDAGKRRVQGVLGEAQTRRISGGRVQALRQGWQGSLDPRELQSDSR